MHESLMGGVLVGLRAQPIDVLKQLSVHFVPCPVFRQIKMMLSPWQINRERRIYEIFFVNFWVIILCLYIKT